jgi:hypothetical protein
MKIHPLWYVCISTRLLLILGIIYFYNKRQNSKPIKIISCLILLLIGLGFIKNAITGSNNEIQISKVFWHETRYVHGLLYITASIYLYNDNIRIASLLLALDLIFSISYRVVSGK